VRWNVVPTVMIPFRPGIFNLLEVRIVGHGHKLHVCRPPEDGVVRPWEPHHFEGEGSMRKLCNVPNVMGRSICLIGSASIPGMTPWNNAVNGLSWDRRMSMSSSMTRRAR
jgi:hypothetical protein